MTAAAAVDPREVQLRALAALLMLEQSLRRAVTAEEVGATLVNDLAVVMPLEAAALWTAGPAGGRIGAVMGLPEPVRDAPFTVWCRAVAQHLAPLTEPSTVDAAALPPALAAEWAEFMPSHLAWTPVGLPGGESLGGLLLGRGLPWREEDLRLLGRIAETAAHALDRLARARPAFTARRVRLKPLAVGLAGVAVAALFIPVPLTALAPAEIRSAAERIVRAPLEGVVGEVLVEPNQVVEAGQLLVRFDDIALRTRLDKAMQDLAIAEAEFRQAQQTAMRDAEVASRRAVLAAQVTQARAEVDHVTDLLSRVEVRADQPGIAVIPDRDSLPGRPMRLGERLLAVADPARVEVESWLPVEEVLPLAPGAEMSLYLNVAPDETLHGTVRSIDYHASPAASGTLAFRVVADLAETDAPPRIGLRGTARLEGGRVFLYDLLFRRPWAAVRPWLGL